MNYLKAVLLSFLAVFTLKGAIWTDCSREFVEKNIHLKAGKVAAKDLTLESKTVKVKREAGKDEDFYHNYEQSSGFFTTDTDDEGHDRKVSKPVEIAAQTVTLPSSAEIDYKVGLGKAFRKAKATLIAATQSFVSLVPLLKEEVKVKVLMANLANRISVKAADPESAHILSETFGKKKVFRGKANGIAHYDEVPAISPQALLHFKKFHAVVVEVGFRKVKLGPL